jgi:hypothetical protein
LRKKRSGDHGSRILKCRERDAGEPQRLEREKSKADPSLRLRMTNTRVGMTISD